MPRNDPGDFSNMMDLYRSKPRGTEIEAQRVQRNWRSFDDCRSDGARAFVNSKPTCFVVDGKRYAPDTEIAAYCGSFEAIHGPLPKRIGAGLIYFIEAVGGERIKIGFTAKNDPSARAKELQIASPFELKVIASFPGTLDTERRMHKQFAHLRVRPRGEWFRAGEDLRDFIRRIS